MTHILWDWNGTLLDDTQAALDTLNIMLARRGGRPIAMDFYRDHFSFPGRNVSSISEQISKRNGRIFTAAGRPVLHTVGKRHVLPARDNCTEQVPLFQNQSASAV